MNGWLVSEWHRIGAGGSPQTNPSSVRGAGYEPGSHLPISVYCIQELLKAERVSKRCVHNGQQANIIGRVNISFDFYP